MRASPTPRRSTALPPSLVRSAVCVAIASGLTACGGGATAPLVHSDDTDVLATGAYVNPKRITVELDELGDPAGKVKVGIVDTGFLVDHFELRDEILASQVFAGGTITDDVVQHGTQVAMVLAGRFMGHTANADLLLAKAANSSGAVSATAASQAGLWALSQGAKVLNFSVGPFYRHYGAASDAIYGQAVTNDAVIVMAAGNESASLTEQLTGVADIFDTGREAYRNIALVVGASEGNALASYSNFPGADATVQSRFLVAVGTNPVQGRNATTPATTLTGPTSWFSGTSSSTPVVSAAATALRAYWPHLSAADTTQLLLDTADRSFTTLYSQNTCGASGALNCGTYTFGQGRLDLDNAMLPFGVMSLPAGSLVSSSAYAFDSTELVLPAAFGDALAGRRVDAALFDSYGRDFGFNLVSRLSVGRGASLLRSGLLDADGGTAMPERLPLTFADGRWSAHLTHGTGARLTPVETPVPLASLAGSGPLGGYGAVNGLDLQAQMGQGLALRWGAWVGQGLADSTGGSGPQAVRQEAGVSWRWGADAQIGVGYAFTGEQRALMGRPGSAGLALQGTTQQAAIVEGRYRLGDGLTLFGRAEWGTLQAQGRGLLTRLDSARTSQWALGLSGALDAAERKRWVLAVSQPVRVDHARATFDVPVGRTVDGAVLRQTESLALAPSGRQFNLELAYRHQIDAQTHWGFNAVWAQDYGHVAGQQDWAVMARYSHRW